MFKLANFATVVLFFAAIADSVSPETILYVLEVAEAGVCTGGCGVEVETVPADEADELDELDGVDEIGVVVGAVVDHPAFNAALI